MAFHVRFEVLVECAETSVLCVKDSSLPFVPFIGMEISFDDQGPGDSYYLFEVSRVVWQAQGGMFVVEFAKTDDTYVAYGSPVDVRKILTEFGFEEVET